MCAASRTERAAAKNYTAGTNPLQGWHLFLSHCHIDEAMSRLAMQLANALSSENKRLRDRPLASKGKLAPGPCALLDLLIEAIHEDFAERHRMLFNFEVLTVVLCHKCVLHERQLPHFAALARHEDVVSQLHLEDRTERLKLAAKAVPERHLVVVPDVEVQESFRPRFLSHPRREPAVAKPK